VAIDLAEGGSRIPRD